jgi:hypothetical protein
MGSSVPLNLEKKPLLVTLGISPTPGEHPCVFTYKGVKLCMFISSKFDHSFVLMPLYVKDGKLPNIPVVIPEAFPPSYESLIPYVDVPNVSQLRLAQGQYRSGKNKGKKREQQRVYATILINSELCIKFLVDSVAPVLDMKRMSLSVKQLQCIRTVTLWAIGALSADVCPVYIKEILSDLIEDEIAAAKEGDVLATLDEVPNFAITVKNLRLPAAVNKSDSQTNLEHYSQSLKRCLMIECEERQADAVSACMTHVDKTAGLKSKVCHKSRLISIPDFQNSNKAQNSRYRRMCEGHIAFQANIASLEVADINDLSREVDVIMAPQVDGTVPDTPYHFTSIYRELMSYCDSDDRQLIDSATMIKSGPRCGFCLLNFRQTEECEEFAVKFASNPCAMLRLLSLNIKGFREDMVINLCKSFDLAARGRALRFIWDPVTWSTVPIDDDDDIDHDFLDNLQKDGYILTDDMKENQGTGNIVEVSRVVAESDMELLKQMGVASDDVTLGTKHGKSVIGDCTSVATQNT